ncbi:MAG: biopolymer transporter ExbD [Hydrogenovibrio sp.]|nr:biopolymer transporter ExbD [Hydrogenovibrio sp.]
MSMRSSLRPGAKKKLMSEMNVVPYIDVTLILLIIFMITAPIVQQAVTVELPQTPKIKADKPASASDQQVPFVITVTKEGYYKTSENPKKLLSAPEIASEVVARAQLHPNQTFTIQGDRLTPYQNVMHLFVVLKANGVQQVSLMTEPENN